MTIALQGAGIRGFARRIPGSRSTWGAAALVVGIGFLVLWPLAQLQIRAFENGADGVRQLADRPKIGEVVKNTVTLALGSTVVAVVCGTALAWCVSRLSPRVRRFVGVFPMIPLIVPSVAVVSGWAFLLSPTVGYLNTLLRKLPLVADQGPGPIDVYSVPWIVLITGFTLTSFVFLFVDTGLRNLGREYELAAAANGASEFRTFFTVTLPMLRPSIVYAASTVLLLGLGQFTAPLLLGARKHINVLTTELFYLKEDFPVNYALGGALGTPLLAVGILVIVGQRLLIGDPSRFATGAKSAPATRPRSSRLAVTALSAYVFVSTILPLLALSFVALSPFWTGKLNLSSLTTRHFDRVFGDSRLTSAIWGSVRYSILAMLILLPIGFLCATVLRERSRVHPVLRSLVDVISTLPLAVPSTLFGFGLLFTYTRPPFVLYGTSSVMVLTYVTLMLPHATRLQHATLISIGEDAREASATSGGGPIRTTLRVMIPLARKGVAASAAIMVILLAHEFSASLMVRSADTEVMGTVLWDLWINGIYPQVAVVALVMVAVTVIGVAVAFVAAGRSGLEGMG